MPHVGRLRTPLSERYDLAITTSTRTLILIAPSYLGEPHSPGEERLLDRLQTM